MKMHISFLASIVAVAATMFAVSCGDADPPGQTSSEDPEINQVYPSPADERPGTDLRQGISEEDMRLAAKAHVEVVEAQRNLRQSLREAEAEGEDDELRERTERKIGSAVRDTGLAMERYEEIIALVARDEAARTEFMQAIQDMELWRDLE